MVPHRCKLEGDFFCFGCKIMLGNHPLQLTFFSVFFRAYSVPSVVCFFTTVKTEKTR